MTYEIGYRKPPASGQFKKGSSGNPKGRPKGSQNALATLKKVLETPVLVNDKGKQKKMSRDEAILTRIAIEAMQGNQKAMAMIINLKHKMGDFSHGCATCSQNAERADRAEQALDEELARQELIQDQARAAVKKATAIFDKYAIRMPNEQTQHR